MRQRTLGDTRFSRERQESRELILKQKLVPDILVSHGRYFWDGSTARRPDGTRVFLREENAIEMVRLCKAGTFGNLSDVLLDFNQYLILRDLIDQARGFQDLRELALHFFC